MVMEDGVLGWLREYPESEGLGSFLSFTLQNETGASRALEILGTPQKGKTANQGQWLKDFCTRKKVCNFNMSVVIAIYKT